MQATGSRTLLKPVNSLVKSINADGHGVNEPETNTKESISSFVYKNIQILMGDWVNKPPGLMRLYPVCITGTNNKGEHTKIVARFLRSGL